MAYTKLSPRFTRDARVEEISPGSAYRLFIPSGKADKYRFAQLDDYAQVSRGRFPHRHPPSTSSSPGSEQRFGTGLTLSLSARTSSGSIAGTWGFGLWNDPFGLSLGFGGNPFRLPALPNAAWFFGASKENYLSFKDDKPAYGFLAQTFRSPGFHPILLPAGFALPFSRKNTRRLLGKVIDEDAVPVSVDVTAWHRYGLIWEEKRLGFEVDKEIVFESPVSPHPPLGLVIWIDNQFASFTPDGKTGFGVLANEEAWLEIRDLKLESQSSL